MTRSIGGSRSRSMRMGRAVERRSSRGTCTMATTSRLQFDGSNNLTHRYLHGPAVDQILADENVGGTLYWPLTDDLGTVRDLVNSSGTVQNHLKYDSFGKVTAESNSAVDHLFAFTGRERDEETGLQYHRARYLDLVVGRWVSEDPWGFSGGDANHSRYVSNHPTIAIDCNGLWEQPAYTLTGDPVIRGVVHPRRPPTPPTPPGPRVGDTMPIQPTRNGRRFGPVVNATVVGGPGWLPTTTGTRAVFTTTGTVAGDSSVVRWTFTNLDTTFFWDVSSWRVLGNHLATFDPNSVDVLVLNGHGSAGGGVSTLDPNVHINILYLSPEYSTIDDIIGSRLRPTGMIVNLGCCQGHAAQIRYNQDLVNRLNRPMIVNTGDVEGFLGVYGRGYWIRLDPQQGQQGPHGN